MALFAIWELLVRTKVLPVYLYGQPSGILAKAQALLAEGELIKHIGATAFASILGFLVGTTLGSVAGLLMWLSKTAALILRPVIVAINGVPKIALAPLIVVWFGVGLGAKVAIAASLTFIVALISVYQGTQEIDEDLVKLMRSLGARPFTIWRKVCRARCHALDPVDDATQHRIRDDRRGCRRVHFLEGGPWLHDLQRWALYDLNSVFVGIFSLMALALVLDAILGRIEDKFKW